MKALDQWIAAGKIAQFVAGSLDATSHAEIFEAAKTDAAVRAAIAAAKAQLLGDLVAQAMTQDPDALIASGMLEQYSEGELDAAGRQMVEIMAMAHPQVSRVMDVLKRDRAQRLLSTVQLMDPQELIDSPLLMDYVLGECDAADRMTVEIARVHFPEVNAALASLEAVDIALVNAGTVHPPLGAKRRFLEFVDQSAMPSNGWGLVMPPLGELSQSLDFNPWTGQIDAAGIDPTQNLNVFPLEADEAMLTLFVVVRDRLDEEVHVDSIERFLVLEGSCVIEMGTQSVYLQTGDYYSIPKFTAHTVVVTSTIPCKLIVQQVAA